MSTQTVLAGHFLACSATRQKVKYTVNDVILSSVLLTSAYIQRGGGKGDLITN